MPEVDGSFRTKNCSTLHPRVFVWSCIESIRPCFWLIAVIRFIEWCHPHPVNFKSCLIKIRIPSPPDSGYRLSINTFLEAGGWEVIKKYVEMGLGIAIVTAICLKGDEKIAKIPLDRFFPNRSYGVVMRKRKYLSPPARQFLEMMAPDFSGQLEKSVGE